MLGSNGVMCPSLWLERRHVVGLTRSHARPRGPTWEPASHSKHRGCEQGGSCLSADLGCNAIRGMGKKRPVNPTAGSLPPAFPCFKEESPMGKKDSL